MPRTCQQWIPFFSVYELQDTLYCCEQCCINVLISSCKMPTLRKSGVSRPIFVKALNIKFHKNPSSVSRADTCRQTDRQADDQARRSDLERFATYENAPKNIKESVMRAINFAYTRRTNQCPSFSIHEPISTYKSSFLSQTDRCSRRLLSPVVGSRTISNAQNLTP